MLPNEEGFSKTKLEIERRELLLPSLRDTNGLKEYCSSKIVIYERRPKSLKDYMVHQQFTKQDKTFRYEVLKNEEVNGMQFDSDFDSGNLHQVLYVNDETFELVVQSDINTTGYTNWFHFKITIGEDAPESINLSIINLVYTFQSYIVKKESIVRDRIIAGDEIKTVG